MNMCVHQRKWSLSFPLHGFVCQRTGLRRQEERWRYPQGALSFSSGPLRPGWWGCSRNAISQFGSNGGKCQRLNARLTIMLTPQWAEFIAADPRRLSVLDEWRAAGHEIAGHHHSVYHPGTWDGYSDFDESQRTEILGPRLSAQTFMGDLAALQSAIATAAPNLVSGCGNAERDKRVLPESFVYDTCPGFYTSNEHPFGTRLNGSDPLAGLNEFLLGGTINGNAHRFLNHAIISGPFLDQVKMAFEQYQDGVWGVVVHTKDADVETLDRWLTFASAAVSARSVTVREAVETSGLPIKTLDVDLLEMIYPADRP